MSPAMQELLDILDLEQLEHNLYRGRSPKVDWQRVFGGQVIGQALVAAQRTVEPDRHVHSLHGYFMRPGDTKVPIIYEVDRIRDGGSFTTRRVTAIQHGQAIFSLEASFQVDEDGLDHQLPMPLDVPSPDTLMNGREVIAKYGDRVPEDIRRYWERDRPIEMKPVFLEHYTSREKLPPVQQIWIRADRAGPRRPRHPVGGARLSLRHDAARHLDLRAWPRAVRSGHPGGEPRPRHVVPPAAQARRLAALYAGQPVGVGRRAASRAA